MTVSAKSGAPVVAAIGNLDGVHLGHRFLLAETAAFAADQGAAPGAVTFEPHPRRHFRPDDPPFLITTPARKESLIRAAGVERVFVLTFDRALAATSADDFVRDVLRDRLGLAGIVAGSDFRFGAGRTGDADALQRLCVDAGMAVRFIEPKSEDGAFEKLSSSAVRAAIAAGDMRTAARILGRLWAVDAVVDEGQRLGRTLGFPTANLALGPLVAPRAGVYAVRVDVDGALYGGVANYGRRPTVGAPAPLLEAHLFDFSGDLYDRRIDVRFVDFIREERKFDGLDALKAQIAADCDAARSMLAT